MKRIIAMLLLAATLLAMVSCQGIEDPATTAGTATETGEAANPTENESSEDKGVLITTKIADPLTWDDINAIPIAKAGMTEMQLRQICVDFFRLTQSVPWVANENIDYIITSGARKVSFKADVRMGGLPYITEAAANNLYTFMQYYDSETGVLDASSVGGRNIASVIGNQCSAGALWGWTRVVNSATCQLTNTMHKGNGCIPVGPYDYADDLGNWSDSNNTVKVCKSNGDQKIYESYANCKIGDGMVQYRENGGGHVVMISMAVEVKRLANGTIDGNNSFITILEQGHSPNAQTLPDGTQITYIGGVDRKFSFARLCDTGYIPFTFAEFLGTDPIETAEVTLSENDGSLDSLRASVVTANYAISDVTITVTDASGKVLYSKIGENTYFNKKTLEMDKILLKTMSRYAGNNLSLDCRISTGEIINIYNATFTA